MEELSWETYRFYLLLKGTVLTILICILSENANAQTLPECYQYEIYTVQEGDDLDQISLHFGDIRFRIPIYESNMDFAENLNQLTPGQTLRIPINIYNYKEADLSISEVLENPFCLPDKAAAGDLIHADADSIITDDMTEEELLEEFRRAFESLVEADADTIDEDNNGHLQAEQQILLEIDGMVIDETRSKVGRDFYDLFYQSWQAPQEVSRFTITISEQPAPGLGTIVTVRANETETFRHRLQPRYEVIQEAARFAVRITHNHLEQNPQDFIIY